MTPLYTASLLSPSRRKTREVHVGNVTIGGNHPVVIQSMTTSSTRDTNATVDQIEALVGVGCQIVRVTTPTIADVDNLPAIRAEMKRRKVSVPLVADVHFIPAIALKACELVEKVRINPGNFADRKRFDVREYTDAKYQEEIDRIREAFLPIVRRAKKNGVALRIGTNHGSLSDRIMNRYGDTPLGMVESALEFVRIAEDEGFKEIVLSMKASNTQVMIQAYRLLVVRMNELKMDYPLHLGVTEAGDGEDGRIKSSVGIGSLLADGLGDTIRVSLTEDSVHEIPVAQCIARLYTRSFAEKADVSFSPTWDPYSYSRRQSDHQSGVVSTGGSELVRVRTGVEPSATPAISGRNELDPSPEILSVTAFSKFAKPEFLNSIPKEAAVVLRLDQGTAADILSTNLRFDALSISPSPAWGEEAYLPKLKSQLGNRPLWLRVRSIEEIDMAIALATKMKGRLSMGIEVEGKKLISLGRTLATRLAKENLQPPMHLHFHSGSDEPKPDVLVRASVELGSLLCDGIGDSIEISSPYGAEFNHPLAFNILQATRMRMSKTEYIACPSCGRTLFDLQETTARIRAKTSHLKGVKIAIMGCIVNGPGEMADADFGYVGSGPDKINLYVGKECVERHIPFTEADERLMNLIKSHGRWVDPV